MLKHLWVRLMAALSICLLSVTAFAAEVANEDVTKVAIDNPAVFFVSMLNAFLTRILQPNVDWFPTWLARYRVLLSVVVSISGGWIASVSSGASYSTAIWLALGTYLPSLAVELVHLFGGGGPGKGKPAISDADAKSAPQPTPYSAPPGTKLVMLGLAFALMACGATLPKILTVIADVTSIVQEAQSLAASARDEESQYFLRHPNADAQAKVESALSDVEQSLAAFSRASKGVTESSLGQLDAAQADFVLAWKKLEVVLRDLGVMHGNKIAGSPGAAPAEIREPMLLTAKLHS